MFETLDKHSRNGWRAAHELGTQPPVLGKGHECVAKGIDLKSLLGDEPSPGKDFGRRR